MFWRKNWETAMSDRIAQLFGPRNMDLWCRNFKFFTAKVYTPNQNIINLKCLNILGFCRKRLINWKSRISHSDKVWTKNATKSNPQLNLAKLPKESKYLGYLWKKPLSGVRSPWFGLKKCPFSSVISYCPNWFGRHFKTPDKLI